jgi:hypothetical protein
VEGKLMRWGNISRKKIYEYILNDFDVIYYVKNIGSYID